MGITSDCGSYADSSFPAKPDSKPEVLAQARFGAYIECMSAHAGRDLGDIGTWHELPAKTRSGWIEQAEKAIKTAKKKRRGRA